VSPEEAALRAHRIWMVTEEAPTLYRRRKEVIEPVFESKPDHTIMLAFARKFGFGDQFVKNIRLVKDKDGMDEPLVEDGNLITSRTPADLPAFDQALARALAFSEFAPPAVIMGLAADQPEVASWVLEHSPLLVDADLVDAVATGRPRAQAAIANRAALPLGYLMGAGATFALVGRLLRRRGRPHP